MRSFLVYGLIAAFAVLLDQVVKEWVEIDMAMYQQVDLLPFFSLFRTNNTGIAFSMFSTLGAPALVALTLGVVALVLYLSWRTAPHQTAARLGFALIIGGAIGNLIDRVTLGHVIDYFLFHTPTWSFAVFNLADAFITIGAGLVVLQEVLDWRRDKGTVKTASDQDS
ncbi:signal peptidase II [Tianweitania sp. BSSL-BM11]|uniref:Lipoprotein signal peptidase n=1 Tax=Tianweitania aestuarii TaxID=2814886 RepID=A0ABS5RQ50_9HYPH|nr:signal peptidase II [Tianweitania aestuarii]MBS9719160.1 signal peptidase II [Tianweitania aestuarii]